MKPKLLLVLVPMAVALAGAWYSFQRSEGGLDTPVPSGAGGLVAVDELRVEPEQYQGDIEVLGVVAATRQSERLFALVDKREVDACGTGGCAEFELPVSWKGPMPGVGTVVVVAGRIQHLPNGFVLLATRVEGQ